MSNIDSTGKHIFLFGEHCMIQAIRDEISVRFAGIMRIKTVSASALHAQITAHFVELKFKSMKINIS